MPRPEPKFSYHRLTAQPYTRDASRITDHYGRKVATIYDVAGERSLDIAKRICATAWREINRAEQREAEANEDHDIVGEVANMPTQEEIDADARDIPTDEPEADKPGKSGRKASKPKPKVRKKPKWVQAIETETDAMVGT